MKRKKIYFTSTDRDVYAIVAADQPGAIYINQNGDEKGIIMLVPTLEPAKERKKEQK